MLFRLLSVTAVTASLFVATPSKSLAAAADASEALRSGIVAFYHADYEEAIEQLTHAAEFDPRDPRIFYFRGLAKLRLGNDQEAEQDFRHGATLEARYQRQDVGLALQRVQGSERLMLEQHRREARKRLQQSRLAIRSARSEPDAEPPEATAQAPVDLPPVEIPATFEQLPPDPADPFAGDRAELLGQGPTEPVAEPAADLPEAQPDSFAQPLNDDDSLFGDVEVGTGVGPNEQASPPSDATADRPKAARKSGVLGSVFRAMTRAVAPVDTSSQAVKRLQQLVPGAAPTQPPLANDVQAGPDGQPAQEDPFAAGPGDPFANELKQDAQPLEPKQAPGGNAGSAPMEEDDPFADEPDETNLDQDPFGDGDASDQDNPFMEEDDPFAEPEGAAPEADDPFGP